MNQLNEWVQLISKGLKSEAELVGVQAKHELYQDSARATFIRVVLEQFLPDSYAIGCGRVIDASGNKSEQQDIVIYRRDFPQLNLPGSTSVFLFESVLATIQVKSKLVRKTFFEALDQCASMAELEPVIDRTILGNIAAKNNLSLNKRNEYEHKDPLLTARFNLIGRPPSFVYAFSGYQTSPRQLEENIEMWIDYRRENQLPVDMKACATVIATQGCFATRNASPFSANQGFLWGIGTDDSPARLIILQLMHALNKRLRASSDSFGVKQGLDAYLKSMPPPKITSSVGKTVYGERAAEIESNEPKAADDSLLNAKVSFSSAPPKAVEPKPEAAPIPEPTLPKLKASTGLGSGIQSKSTARADKPAGQVDFTKTVRVPPIKKKTDPIMQALPSFAESTDKSKASSEPDVFMQAQGSIPETDTDPFSQTIPQLRN